MYRGARGLYNVLQVISAAHSTQGPSGGQARPAQSASEDVPSRAPHVGPRSVAHSACHSPPPQSKGSQRASMPLRPPPSSPALGHPRSQKPPSATWGGGEHPEGARSYTGPAGKLLPPAPAQECPQDGNDVQSGSPSRLQTNPPPPGTHPHQPGPEIVHILDHTGVCVCMFVGINYHFVPRVKVMQSAILSK